MKELIFSDRCSAIGVEVISWREIGDSFEEWVLQVPKGLDFDTFQCMLREFDFYEIRIDIGARGEIACSRVLY